MPAGTYKSVNVGCPFFRRDDGSHRITCEGLIPRGSLTVYFERKKDFEQQMEIFCCQNWRCCEIYRVAMDKYDEE